MLSEHRYCLDREHPASINVFQEHFLPSERDPIETAENIACRFLSKLDPFDLTISIERHLESAKETLVNDFDFVGITEQMDESIALFCTLLGWKIPPEIPIHNTTNREGEHYSQELLASIAERNWADIELYTFATQLFEQEKRAITSRTEVEPIRWVTDVDYPFSSSLDGSGWCPRETTLKKGTFRWLGSSERGEIEFPLEPSRDYYLEIELFMQPSLLKKLRISINDTPIKYQIDYLNKTGWFSQLKRWIKGIFASWGDGEEKVKYFKCRAAVSNSLLHTGEKTRLEIAIEDENRPPMRDFYRGRCGSNRITFTPNRDSLAGAL